MKKNNKNRGLVIVILVVFVIMALLPFVAALQATPQPIITSSSLEDATGITPASPEEPVENIIVEDIETSSDPVE